MSNDEFAQLIRIFSFVTSAIVLLLIVGATIYRFKTMDAVERLFIFGMIGKSVFIMGVTYNGFHLRAPLFWYTPVLAVANIWMIGAIVVLTLRPPKINPPSIHHLGPEEPR